MNNIKICSLSTRDIVAMNKLHIEAFPDRALSLLGESAISSYYQILLDHPKFCLRIGAFDGARLVGFLVGGEMNGITPTFVRKNLTRLALHVITHPWLLAKPIVRSRIRMTVKMLRKWKPRTQPQPRKSVRSLKTFSILVIAVDPTAQCKGVGKQLMQRAEQVAAEHGYDRMHLSVDVNNTNAIGFYEHLNWKRHHPEKWCGGMIKPLVHNAIPQASPKVQARLEGLPMSD